MDQEPERIPQDLPGRKDAMSVMSVLKNLFSKPYVKVPAAPADRGAVLLDVREPHEWQAGHAPSVPYPTRPDSPAGE